MIRIGMICHLIALNKHTESLPGLLPRMTLNAVIICAALCLGLTAGQMQLRVYRGTLVHSRVPEQIEVLQDYLLGFDANNLGEVSATVWCLLSFCLCKYASWIWRVEEVCQFATTFADQAGA